MSFLQVESGKSLPASCDEGRQRCGQRSWSPYILKLQTFRSCLSLVCSLALVFFLIVVHKIINTSFGCVLCRSTGTGQGKRKKKVPSWCRLSMRWEYFSYGKCQSRELCPVVDSLLYVLPWVVVM